MKAIGLNDLIDLNWLILIHLLKSWDLTIKTRTSASLHDEKRSTNVWDTPWPRTKSETTNDYRAKAFQKDRKSSPFVDNFVCLCTFLKHVFTKRGHVSNAEKSAEKLIHQWYTVLWQLLVRCVLIGRLQKIVKPYSFLTRIPLKTTYPKYVLELDLIKK